MPVSEINTIEGLCAIETEWRELWLRCPDATPFQSPDWLIPWWVHLGSGELRVLAATAGGRLYGLAPLFASPQGKLALLGEGVSDYLDILLDPECSASSEGFFTHICSLANAYPGCSWSSLKEGSILVTALCCTGSARAAVGADSVCPVVTLPGSFQELMDAAPAALARNYRRGLRMLSAGGQYSIGYATRDSFGEYLDAFFALHASRWNERGQPGVLAGEGVRGFHRCAAVRLLTGKCLRLYGLKFRGQIRSVAYTLFHRDTVYLYLGAFDPLFKKFSPGTVVIGEALRDAVHEGKKEFDFLRGAEDYKYSWGAVDRQTYAISFFAEGA